MNTYNGQYYVGIKPATYKVLNESEYEATVQKVKKSYIRQTQRDMSERELKKGSKARIPENLNKKKNISKTSLFKMEECSKCITRKSIQYNMMILDSKRNT